MVVISGPSGSGKTSVVKALKAEPRVEFSVSATTRKIRPGERDGVDYHFLAREDFERRIATGEFLEWAEYNGRFYGTLRAPMRAAIDAGRVFLLEIEVKGTRQLRQAGEPGLYIFLAPPSLDELRRRLVARGTDSADEIERRVSIAEEEMRHGELYDHILVNVDLDATIARVRALIGL
ncbi:MAG: guanylate kinase [Planctomycetota bacterium]